MTPRLFIVVGFMLMAVLGWLRALTRRRDLDMNHEWIPSAYQLRAWEKQRLVRAEGNRRIS